MADLARAIDLTSPLISWPRLAYGNSNGKLTWCSRCILKDLDDDIQGKDVLLVEDNIDTGNTPTKVKRDPELRGPKSIEIRTPLDKPSRREVEVDTQGSSVSKSQMSSLLVLASNYAFKNTVTCHTLAKVVPQE